MTGQINMEDLRTAIEQVRPELPAVLDKDYPAFVTELNSYLEIGSKNRLWDLFGRYPAAHERLRVCLAQPGIETTKGLFGNINLYKNITIFLPDYSYRCENGPHILTLQRVEKRDAAGRPLCPQHGIAMSLVRPEDIRMAIERLRPTLPQLLGADSAAFVTELDALLPGWDYEQLGKLFERFPAADQRLRQILAEGPLVT